MLYFLLFLRVSAEPACASETDRGTEVCLLQFMHKTGTDLEEQKREENHAAEDESQDATKHTPLDDIAAAVAGDHHRIRECPGESFVSLADLKACTHGGADIHVDFDDEDIEEFFADNVIMKEWRYFLNDCDSQKADCELINPDVNHHQYPVGRTQIRVEGYDLAGNMNKCLRTVYIMDKQAPIFKEPEVDLNQKLELHFPEESCVIYGGTPFTEYEEQAGFNDDHNPLATDNCDSDVEIVRKLFDETGRVIYDSSIAGGHFPKLAGPGTWKMCYVAIDDYSKTLGGVHAFKTWEPAHGDCPTACRFCAAGKNPDAGGVELVDGVCNKWCSPTNTCGTSDAHKEGTECTKCAGHSNAWMVNKAEHCVELTLTDITPPYDYAGCPDDIYVEIDAHLNSTEITWTPPTISGDNCDAHGTVPDAMEQSDPPKYPGMTFPVGSHVVNYAVEDAFGNVLEDEECTFTVEVKQKAHPVDLVCPADVILTTLEDASFAIVTWEPPVATQGGKILEGKHIVYPQGVEPGLPFPFGTTTILVHADGEITGKRADEHLMFDECIFNVTVKDPQRPEVDGRLYRCREDQLDHSHFAMPFRVCEGPDLAWVPHPKYIHTHGYDIIGTHPTSLECCTSEEGVDHVCTKVTTPVDVEPLVSYCKPKP
jgi:hypothetical protein